jgi:methionine synthase I (cobalamin-dependent)
MIASTEAQSDKSPMTGHERSDELVRRLRARLLVGDGGMGTALSAGSRAPGECAELLNAEDPDRVRAVHSAFLEAGADLLQTNTFQANRAALDRHGLAGRTAELNAAGAALAREVAGERALVAGSIGPTGRLLIPYGDFEQKAALAAFREQAAALAEAGVDFLIIETMSAVEEALLALRAAISVGCPAAVSLAFGPAGRTDFGVTPKQAVEQLTDAGASVIGANCGTASPIEMVDIISEFHEATDLPLIAQPNAGRPHHAEAAAVYPEPPERMADAAERFRDLGAAIVGGCCGTTPEHIRAMALRLQAR